MTRVVLVLAVTGVAGLLLLIAANRFDRPELIGPGLILFAIGIVTAGGHAVTTRYLRERRSVAPGSRVFEGPAAIFSGLAVIVLGLSMGVAGVAFLVGAEGALLDIALRRPGLALVPAGLASAAWGAGRVLGAREWRGSWWRLVANIPERIGGAMLLLLGAALLGLGGFELLAPDAFARALENFLAQVR